MVALCAGNTTSIFHPVFGNSGFVFSYNSSGRFSANATVNGNQVGPSAYYSNNKFDLGTSNNGWHDGSNTIRVYNSLIKSVAQAEKNAKSEYWGQKALESTWNAIIDFKNTMIGGDDKDYNAYISKSTINYQEVKKYGDLVSFTGSTIEYSSVKNLFPLTTTEKSLVRAGKVIDWSKIGESG